MVWVIWTQSKICVILQWYVSWFVYNTCNNFSVFFVFGNIKILKWLTKGQNLNLKTSILSFFAIKLKHFTSSFYFFLRFSLLKWKKNFFRLSWAERNFINWKKKFKNNISVLNLRTLLTIMYSELLFQNTFNSLYNINLNLFLFLFFNLKSFWIIVSNDSQPGCRWTIEVWL